MNERPDGGRQLYYGLYPAIVSDSSPDSLGRVEVELPWLGTNPSDEAGQRGDAGDPVKVRATLMSSWAGPDQGLVAIPAKDSQVIVGFEAGNLARPYIVGACWNGRDQMAHEGLAPEGGSSPSATEKRRVLRTKAGSFVELDDTEKSTKVTISTSAGHKLVLDMSGDEVLIEHSGGHSLTLKPDGSIDVTANNTVNLTAPSGFNITAPTSTFSGDVVCNNITATQVISPKYTPGVGNLW